MSIGSFVVKVAVGVSALSLGNRLRGLKEKASPGLHGNAAGVLAGYGICSYRCSYNSVSIVSYSHLNNTGMDEQILTWGYYEIVTINIDEKSDHLNSNTLKLTINLLRSE